MSRTLFQCSASIKASGGTLTAAETFSLAIAVKTVKRKRTSGIMNANLFITIDPSF